MTQFQPITLEDTHREADLFENARYKNRELTREGLLSNSTKITAEGENFDVVVTGEEV